MDEKMFYQKLSCSVVNQVVRIVFSKLFEKKSTPEFELLEGWSFFQFVNITFFIVNVKRVYKVVRTTILLKLKIDSLPNTCALYK